MNGQLYRVATYWTRDRKYRVSDVDCYVLGAPKATDVSPRAVGAENIELRSRFRKCRAARTKFTSEEWSAFQIIEVWAHGSRKAKRLAARRRLEAEKRKRETSAPRTDSICALVTLHCVCVGSRLASFTWDLQGVAPINLTTRGRSAW